MTAAAALRVAAVLDARDPGAEKRSRALGGFLRDGLRAGSGAACETLTHLVVTADERSEAVIAQAPTRDLRLVHAPPHRPDLLAAALTAFQAGGGADLYVFPGGPLGAELAARLAARTGGSVLTGVLDAEAGPDLLTCRRAAYANHLAAAVELRRRPWCITLDAAWADAGFEAPTDHTVHAEVTLGGEDHSSPAALAGLERLEPPPTGDLETARLLVVAGRGAGSAGGVERIRAAAARLGAAFGVTRPVVMNAWAPPDRQVGVSGTRTAPDVCLVAGASGAPAFLWGVERAAFIAAIDSDDHAPIASEADVVVVDDAVAVMEALAALVDERP